jgi:hypothetical protein
VREAQRRGVEAYGWLPRDHGARALAAYAQDQGAAAIVIPEELSRLKGFAVCIIGTSCSASEQAETSKAKLIIASKDRPTQVMSLRSIGFDPDDWA